MSYSNVYARWHASIRKAREALAAVWHFYPSRFYFIFLGASQVIAWLQAAYIYSRLSSKLLVIHYNINFGVDRVGEPANIFFYPSFGLAVLIVNLALAAVFSRHKDFKIFTHLLLGAAALFGFFLNLVLLSVYLINFF